MTDSSAPANVQPTPTDGLEQYMLHDRDAIRHLLRQLIDRHALINAHVGSGEASFLTALVAIADTRDALYIDSSPDAALNRHVAEARQLTCVTQLDGVRVQFRLSGLAPAEHDGHKAFRAALPDGVLRLQRRESYRLTIPTSEKAICWLESKEHVPAGPLECRIVDLSATGTAVDIPPDTQIELAVGTEIDPCTLELPGVAPITCTLQVRNTSQRQTRAGTKIQRIGFLFVGLPRNAEAKIQRFIFKIERERNARKLGIW